jgi:7-alpha-hydroxysteroid dehydrogenase
VLLDRFRITDRVAIVTGAGRGIGRASALALAEQGADVVLAARTQEQLDLVADEVRAMGRKAAVVATDVSDTDNLDQLVDTAISEFGRLDIVVNNVGGSMPRPFLDTSARRLVEAFTWNVATAHALTRAAVPIMLESGGGSVVSMSSMMGRSAARGFVAYGTAKGALSHWTRLAAEDLAPRIRVNAIAVGSVATSALEVVLTDDALRTTMEDTTPLGRIGEPADIAAAVVYLSSDAGAYVTGKVVEVDGGLLVPNLDLGLPDL